MICPSCGDKDAYQGFNYRDGQVDCVNTRCVYYNEKHADAVGKADLDDTRPTRKAATLDFSSATAMALLDRYVEPTLLSDVQYYQWLDRLFGNQEP